jgi:hypothetical protein
LSMRDNTVTCTVASAASSSAVIRALALRPGQSRCPLAHSLRLSRR